MTIIKPATIRRLTKLAKSLHPLLPRIPAPLPRPNSDAYRAAAKTTTAEAQRRQETYERIDSRRLDRGTIAFFAEQFHDPRR